MSIGSEDMAEEIMPYYIFDVLLSWGSVLRLDIENACTTLMSIIPAYG